VKEAAHQHDFGSKQMKPGSESLGVFTKDTRAFLYDLVHARVTPGCGFKHHRGQHCNLHFVRRLRPANKFI
jgi:hypothetical protein